MRQIQTKLGVRTRGRGLYEITEEVVTWQQRQAIATGLLTVFCPHTSASLIVQENSDPNAGRELEHFFRRLARQERSLYRSLVENEEELPAYVRGALCQSQVAVPVGGGTLLLGSWQGLFVYEHRSAPQSRELVLHLAGE